MESNTSIIFIQEYTSYFQNINHSLREYVTPIREGSELEKMR